MKAQTATQNDMMALGQRVADLFSGFSKGMEKFHTLQNTQKSFVGKFKTVKRFGAEHEVEYCFVSDELEINSIDGDVNIELTYSKDFIEFIEQEIIKETNKNSDNDEEYDNYFQNHEAV